MASLLLLVAIPLSLASAAIDVLPGDVAVTRAIQEWDGTAADRIAVWVSWIGNGFPQAAALALALVVVLAAAGYRAEALLIAASMIVRLVSTPLKALFGSPRPTPDLARIIEEADGLGFPSGHALGAILLYGALAGVSSAVVRDRRWRLALQAFSLVMIVATGFARVRVGAHWPTDVLGGYLWGGAILALLVAAYRAARHKDR